jgi:hypothetical protein
MAGVSLALPSTDYNRMVDHRDSKDYQIFIAIDGDRVGDTLERLILSNDLEGVRRFSAMVATALGALEEYLISQGCDIVFAAGDGLLAASHTAIDADAIVLNHGELTFSVGIASDPSESLLALKMAKGLGRCRVTVRNRVA